MKNNEKSLFDAIANGKRGELRRLLSLGANPNVKNEFKETPLMLACAQGDGVMARMLIEAGAKVDARNKNGSSALIYAAEQAEKASLIKLLVEQGASVDGRDCFGCTALMRAAARGHLGIVVELLRFSADVNAISINEETPLTFAIVWQRPRIVKKLLHSGANFNWVGKGGWAPLDYAKFEGNNIITQILIERGAKEGEKLGKD